MVATTETPTTASAKLLERAVWFVLVVVAYFRLNLRRWAIDFWHQASAAEHKGLFVSVVTLILTLYVLCIVAPMNAVAEWDTHWRGGSSGRRAQGLTRAR
ncbi:unnamed protein product [Hapterophycus canaliculatus]